MAVSDLNNPQTVFRRYVLTNIQYWRDYVTARTSASSPIVRQHQHTIRLVRQSSDPYNEARVCTNLGYLYVEKGHGYRADAEVLLKLLSGLKSVKLHIR